MIEITNITIPYTGALKVTYEVRHSTPGPGGTCVSEELEALIGTKGQTSLTLNVKDCKADSPDEALDRLATWLTRLAEGLKDRPKSITIPL